VLAIGSTHRGPIGRVVLGSVGEVLVSGCPCPITVAPKGFAQHAPDSIARVVAGFDGSAESGEALAAADRIAQQTGAELQVVGVTHRPTLSRHDGNGAAGNKEALRSRLDEALAGIGGRGEGTVVDGDPAERLSDAGNGADLLVLGARGYGPHHHVMVGSVSSKLMRSAPCPVLILPRPAADDS
jgi:nucleotide-binding universal stress UspA family protein